MLVLECFHKCHSKQVFSEQAAGILSLHEYDGKQTEQKMEVKTGKRDHLINQVVNTNKLRKIDDTIRKTIMIKLNRQTVSLTSEVNELRKEKKNLQSKIKELQGSIKKTKQHLPQFMKENKHSSIAEMVPGNISAIRSAPSNYNSPKLLPFQVYHQNKSTIRSSIHSNVVAKSTGEENSTQLPSIIKNSNYGSIFQQSSLVGVRQIED